MTATGCPVWRPWLDIKVTSISGGWGIPYVTTPGDPPSRDLVVNRGFVVTEVWEPITGL